MSVGAKSGAVMGSIWPTMIQPFTQFIGPLSPIRFQLRVALVVFEFRVTWNCVWAGYLLKSFSSGVIFRRIVPEFILPLSGCCFPSLILWLCWPNVIFFHLTSPVCVCCQMTPRSSRCCTVTLSVFGSMSVDSLPRLTRDSPNRNWGRVCLQIRAKLKIWPAVFMKHATKMAATAEEDCIGNDWASFLVEQLTSDYLSGFIMFKLHFLLVQG